MFDRRCLHVIEIVVYTWREHTHVQVLYVYQINLNWFLFIIGLHQLNKEKCFVDRNLFCSFSNMSQLSINPKCSIYLEIFFHSLSMCILRSLCYMSVQIRPPCQSLNRFQRKSKNAIRKFNYIILPAAKNPPQFQTDPSPFASTRGGIMISILS